MTIGSNSLACWTRSTTRSLSPPPGLSKGLSHTPTRPRLPQAPTATVIPTDSVPMVTMIVMAPRPILGRSDPPPPQSSLEPAPPPPPPARSSDPPRPTDTAILCHSKETRLPIRATATITRTANTATRTSNPMQMATSTITRTTTTIIIMAAATAAHTTKCHPPCLPTFKASQDPLAGSPAMPMATAMVARIAPVPRMNLWM